MKNIFIWWVFLLSSQIENFLLSENVNYGISLCRRQQWIFPSSEARGEIVLWKSKSRHCCHPQRKKLTFNWMWTAAKTRAPREIQTVHYIHRSVCTYCIYIGRRYDSWWENAHLFLAFCPLFFACSRLKCIIKLHAVIPFWLRFLGWGGRCGARLEGVTGARRSLQLVWRLKGAFNELNRIALNEIELNSIYCIPEYGFAFFSLFSSSLPCTCAQLRHCWSILASVIASVVTVSLQLYIEFLVESFG